MIVCFGKRGEECSDALLETVTCMEELTSVYTFVTPQGNGFNTPLSELLTSMLLN